MQDARQLRRGALFWKRIASATLTSLIRFFSLRFRNKEVLE
jgi:hypothetical protein